MATSQGTPGAPRSWKRQGMVLPKSLQREHSPANSLIFGLKILIADFWAPGPRGYISVVLSYQVCGDLLHRDRKLTNSMIPFM